MQKQTTHDLKIFHELEGYDQDLYTGIAIDYPYGSRFDSAMNKDEVEYYFDWGEVIKDQISDFCDVRKFYDLEENESGSYKCVECGDEVAENVISLTWRGEGKWYHLCSSECLLRFAGKRDLETLRKLTTLMNERVNGLQEFIEKLGDSK